MGRIGNDGRIIREPERAPFTDLSQFGNDGRIIREPVRRRRNERRPQAINKTNAFIEIGLHIVTAVALFILSFIGAYIAKESGVGGFVAIFVVIGFITGLIGDHLGGGILGAIIGAILGGILGGIGYAIGGATGVIIIASIFGPGLAVIIGLFGGLTVFIGPIRIISIGIIAVITVCYILFKPVEVMKSPSFQPVLPVTKTITQHQTARVSSDGLNLRKQPFGNADIVKILKRGDTISITGETQDGWTPVEHGSDKGWVSAIYIIRE